MVQARDRVDTTTAGGNMRIDQKELRAWAWWVLALVTLAGATHLFRYTPLPARGQEVVPMWDRLRHRECWLDGVNRVCFTHPNEVELSK